MKGAEAMTKEEAARLEYLKAAELYEMTRA